MAVETLHWVEHVPTAVPENEIFYDLSSVTSDKETVIGHYDDSSLR